MHGLWISSDMDFPTDLEDSFNTGALNSTLNTTLPTHSDTVTLPPSFLDCHQHPPEARDMAEGFHCPCTTSTCVQKVEKKLQKQKAHPALSLREWSLPSHCSPVVPDRDEWRDCSTDQHHFYSSSTSM